MTFRPCCSAQNILYDRLVLRRNMAWQARSGPHKRQED